MTATTDQWMTMQFYNHQSPEEDDLLQVSATMEDLISDATNNISNVTPSSSPSPTSPQAVNNNGSAIRPIRRRSRASKRTPTTLLNANTTNFRALVQQFTGCPSSTAMSFEVYKGPITLNFKQGSRQVLPHHHHHHNRSRTTVTTVSSTAPEPMGNTGFNNTHHVGECQYQQQQQWHQQQSFDDNLFDDNSDLLFSKAGSMGLSDDGLMTDHNFSLHDMTTMDNACFSSNNNEGIQHGSTYYM